MGYSKELYESARRTLAERRAEAEHAAAALKARACARDPRLAEISEELAQSTLRVLGTVLRGMEGDRRRDINEVIAEQQTKNLALQREMAERLQALGESAENFEVQPHCACCGDTGYVGQRMCGCLESLLREGACRELSALSHMTLTRFDELDMTFYSDKPENGVSERERMQGVVDFCRDWAADFSKESPSLLLRGPAGTGKTHLSLAMAREVAEKGFHVVYGSVQRLLHQLEKEHFGRDGGDSADRMENCDLLILDDLGTEFASPFYTSSLYELINSRILSDAPTILSTNLNQKQLQERYGVQIASRIGGCFQPLLFVGEDIRQQKLMRRLREE